MQLADEQSVVIQQLAPSLILEPRMFEIIQDKHHVMCGQIT